MQLRRKSADRVPYRPVIENFRNLGSTADAVTRRCVLGSKQSTSRLAHSLTKDNMEIKPLCVCVV